MRSRRIRTEGLKILPLIAGFLGMIVAGGANALSLGFDVDNDGGFDLIVVDEDTNDDSHTSDGAPVGEVSIKNADLNDFASISGSVWTINSTLARSEPYPTFDPSELYLESFNVSSSGSGSLRIAAWDTYSGPGPTDGFLAAANSLQNGENVSEVNFYQFEGGTVPSGSSGLPVGTTNELSASTHLDPFGGGAEVDSVFANNLGMGSDFDLAVEVVIDHNAADSTEFRAKITPTPLPAAAWLMGSALVLLVGIGRRASRRSGNSALST